MCHHQLYVDEKCVTAVSQFRKIFSVFKKDGLVHPSLYASPLGAPPTTSPSPSLHGPPPTLCRPSYSLICFLLRFCMGLELCRCWSLIQKKKWKIDVGTTKFDSAASDFPPEDPKKESYVERDTFQKIEKLTSGPSNSSPKFDPQTVVDLACKGVKLAMFWTPSFRRPEPSFCPPKTNSKIEAKLSGQNGQKLPAKLPFWSIFFEKKIGCRSFRFLERSFPLLYKSLWKTN